MVKLLREVDLLLYRPIDWFDAALWRFLPLSAPISWLLLVGDALLECLICK
jgi:hypothetical protein